MKWFVIILRFRVIRVMYFNVNFHILYVFLKRKHYLRKTLSDIFHVILYIIFPCLGPHKTYRHYFFCPLIKHCAFSRIREII